MKGIDFVRYLQGRLDDSRKPVEVQRYDACWGRCTGFYSKDNQLIIQLQVARQIEADCT